MVDYLWQLVIMFEPRGTFHSVTLLTMNQSATTDNNGRKRRRRRLLSYIRPQQQQQQDVESELLLEQQQQQQQQLLLLLYEQHFYEEPEIPVHPALEFETQTTERKESKSNVSVTSLLLHAGLSSSSSSVVISPYTGLNDETMQSDNINSDVLSSQPLSSIETPLLLSYNNDNNNTSSSSSRTTSKSWFYRRNCMTRKDLYYWISMFCLIISGVGIVLTLKLQASSMYNYPNFINIYTNLLYIPFCYAYIIPFSAGSSSWIQQANANHGKKVQRRVHQWPSTSLLLEMVIIGTFDAITATLQTFAAVYLPGPLLVLVPQAAIPVSVLFSYCFSNSNKNTETQKRSQTGFRLSMQMIGGIIVLIGIIIVLEPVWTSQRAPDYYCEATDPYNDCATCKIATTAMDCAGTASSKAHHDNMTDATSESLHQWLFNASSTDDGLRRPVLPLPCKWVPFNESTKEKESLEVLWSILLMFSSIPMALSAVYKQRVIHTLSSDAATQLYQTTDSPPSDLALTAKDVAPSSPVLYISGWIAVFQLLVSLLLAIPAGILSSPSIQPWKVPENLLNGLLCYSGYPVVVNGCHPDTMCTSYHVTLWINVGVLCHVVYTVSVMVILQASNSSVPLFLALTATVPLGNFAFSLPLLPNSPRENMHALDLIGLLVIVAGLIMYRFTNKTISCSRSWRHLPSERGTDEESVLSVDGTIKFLSQQIQSSILSLWMQVGNQTSYTLLRETLGPVQSGNV